MCYRNEFKRQKPEIGERLAVPQLPGESNIDYRRRIIDVVAKRRISPPGEVPPRKFYPDEVADFGRWRPALINPVARLPEWGRAAERIRKAIDGGEGILVFGDYDCDGICSVVMTLDFLSAAGASSENLAWFIPNRFEHEYGLKKRALESALRGVGGLKRKLGLVIAVDCGTNSLDEIRKLRQMGIDTVVFDHHLVSAPADHQPSSALVNPKFSAEAGKDEPGFCDLCGAGLVFMFSDAFGQQWGCTEWDRKRAAVLAGLATYGDVVPVLGVNRTLIKHALYWANDETIRSTSLPGLDQLHRRLHARFHEHGKDLPPVVDDTFAFEWAPCINACGRLDDAQVAVDLLISRTAEQAKARAQWCVDMNERRKGIERRILEQAESQALAQIHDSNPPNVLLVCGEAWHIGVVGIVASRVRDQFSRPAIVCGGAVAGVWQGSARSVIGFDIGTKFGEAMKSGRILSGGGHKMAGGLRFEERQRSDFFRWLNDDPDLQGLNFEDKPEVVAFAQEMSEDDWHELFRGLRPFGNGNARIPIRLEDARLEAGEFVFPTPKSEAAEAPEGGNGKAHSTGEETAHGEGSRAVPGNAYPQSAEEPQSSGTKRKAWAARARFKVQDRDDLLDVRWRNPNRARAEWRRGRFYTLELEVQERLLKGQPIHEFVVVNSWQQHPPTNKERLPSPAGPSSAIPRKRMATEVEESSTRHDGVVPIDPGQTRENPQAVEGERGG